MDEMDEIVQEFLVESHEGLDQLDRDLVELEQDPESHELLASVFRTIHTIKGTSGFLAFGKLEAVAHVGENLLARLRDGALSMTPATTDVLLQLVDTVRGLLAAIEATGTDSEVPVDSVVDRLTAALHDGRPGRPRPGADDDPGVPAADAVEPTGEPVTAPASAETALRSPAADASIRVDVEVLDTLMRLVGELVLTRNQLVRQVAEQDDQDAIRSTQRLNVLVGELQEGVMQTRMQPIDHLWSKLPRVVRDLGAQCGKQVHLVMAGGETELDRTLLEAVKDPLTHLVRNAVDHGFETPAARLAAGKPIEGLLALRAFHEGGQVVVEVTDDGAGIDPARIARSVAAKGLRTPGQLADLSPTELLELIFLPGFSTTTRVTNVSGRGVGMDVVRTNLEGIGGAIEVDSTVGEGTTCRLRIPLTLAIVPALTVECAGDRYAIPQQNLLELVSLDAGLASTEVESVNGVPVHRLRGRLLPLVWLADVLDVDGERAAGAILVAVVQAEGRRFGLVVDRVLRTEEIVVKPLLASLTALGAYSGATILGDGRVALILDVEAVARGALGAAVAERRGGRREQPAPEHEEPSRMLVAEVGGGPVGIALSTVTRLEHVPAAAVEVVGHREVLQYGDAILPLLRLDRHLGATEGRAGPDLVVVIFTHRRRSVAMVVDQILDIVEGEPDICTDVDGRGLLGSAVLGERVVGLLDVRAAILAADPHFYSDPGPDPGPERPVPEAVALEAVR